MILKAILLGLVAMLGHTNFLFGTNLLDRPLIMCTLTGLVMGDLKSGIIIGAMMELAFIGAFSVAVHRKIILSRSENHSQEIEKSFAAQNNTAFHTSISYVSYTTARPPKPSFWNINPSFNTRPPSSTEVPISK